MNDKDPNEKFESYKPKTLTPSGVEIKAFKPRSLNGEVLQDYQTIKQKFGSLASTDPKSNANFNLHSESKKLLGIQAEEHSHVESIVSQEVEVRIKALQDQAYAEGFEKGRGEGRVAAEEEFRQETKPLFTEFTALLGIFDEIKQEMYSANEAFLIQLVYQIGKQVLLKDLSADPEYVNRVTTLVIEKLGAKENIKIKISKNDQANIEKLRDFLKAQFPDLKNIQLDVSDDVQLGGCKVETDLSRMDASVETQLKAIEGSLGEQ